MANCFLFIGESYSTPDAAGRAFNSYVGLGIQENGWYCRNGGLSNADADCWNPDNSGNTRGTTTIYASLAKTGF